MNITIYGSSSSGNGYKISDGEQYLLLEAGINLTNRTGWKEADALLITHEHKDHSKFANQILQRSAMNIYCSAGTANKINVPKHRLNILKSGKETNINNWKILPFKVEHDAEEPLGFYIKAPNSKSLVFATDTYYIKYRFPKVNYFMIECNYSREIINRKFEDGKIDRYRKERIATSHFELKNVIQFFKRNDLTETNAIYLLHLSDQNSDAELFKNEVQAATGIPVYIAKK